MVDGGRAAAAANPAARHAGAPASPQPSGAGRDHLRAEDRYPLGVLPAGDGLLRDDPVASAAGLAAGRRLGATAPHPAAALGGCGQDRLESSQRRCLAGAGQKGGAATGPNPTDRGKPGSQHQLVTERGGAPLVVFPTAANVNEGTLLARLVDAIPPLHQPLWGYRLDCQAPACWMW